MRDEGSTNVTGAYVDTGKAFREARAKVDSLLAQLRTADPSEAAAIRQQLVPARQQLGAARAALRGMKQRVTYAPVSVQIRADGDGSWSIAGTKIFITWGEHDLTRNTLHLVLARLPDAPPGTAAQVIDLATRKSGGIAVALIWTTPKKMKTTD